jgi:hypothetical protein
MTTQSELAHVELLAEVDALLADVRRWADSAPEWNAARQCQALAGRLLARAGALRVRWEAPLVVATLGGTGTGKSALVNALVGDEVTPAGRERPTTNRPVLICRPDLSPEMLGIDEGAVHVIRRDLPMLRDLVLIDCPDPDTTEPLDEGGTNLARLRALLPHCDVLLVTSTQQKYRSARVSQELAAAATGARLVFVQTHADSDDDVRDDWRAVLEADYEPGEMFFVDSLSALRDARDGLAPRGQFGRLVDFLSRELAGAAAHRIRRANFLDLVEETLALCGRKIDAALPQVEALEAAVGEQRSRLAAALATHLRDELLAARRHWEARLVAAAAARFGFSPFAIVLRIYQGIGGLLSSAALFRARTTAHVALWGLMETGRRLRQKRTKADAESAWSKALALSWDEAELRTAAIIVDGYAGEAGLPRADLRPQDVAAQAAQAGEAFLAAASAQLQALISKLAARQTGFVTRMAYELALCAMLGVVLYRLGRNFFYDSWLAAELGRVAAPAPLYGTEFLLQAGFWLVLWCLLLIFLFTARLRRGMRSEIQQLAGRWQAEAKGAPLFAALDEHLRAVRGFRDERARLENSVAALRAKLEQREPRLGHRIG